MSFFRNAFLVVPPLTSPTETFVADHRQRRPDPGLGLLWCQAQAHAVPALLSARLEPPERDQTHEQGHEEEQEKQARQAH